MFSKVSSFLVSLYIWAFILVSVFPLFVVYLLLWLLVFPFDRKKVITHFYTMLWTRLYLTCNPGWKLKIENREKLISGHPYILISNHQSIIDIALLLQLRVNFKWISKIELAKVPFVGWVIWMNNHILVKRGDKQSVVMMAETCRKTLDKGMPVFVFPEGTRSVDGNLQPFKEGAFILARENKVLIRPVVIDGAGAALRKEGFLFKTRVVFTVRVLDEIPSEQVQKLSILELTDLTSRLMTDELEKIRRPAEGLDKKLVRKMGFRSDSLGIINRYIQVNGAWDPHLNNTKDYILSAVASKNIRELAVYGSGWLLDLPLEELALTCGHIRLYDMVHPPQILHRIRKLPNVTAETADITGGVLKAVHEAILRGKRERKTIPLPELVHLHFEPEPKPDYIISLNILSQLGDFVVRYLHQHIELTAELEKRVIREIQENHLKMLPTGHSCLITDTDEWHYNPAGQKVSEKKLVLCKLSLDGNCRTWDWHFDPLGEYDEGNVTISKVVAVEL